MPDYMVIRSRRLGEEGLFYEPLLLTQLCIHV